MDKSFSINSGGFSIRCRLYSDGSPSLRSVIVLGHGFGGHKDNRAAERFAVRTVEKNRGAGVLAFDWPCHGDDARNRLRLDDCDAYLTQVLAYAADQYAPRDIFGYASSFGAYLFLRYLSVHGSPFRRTAFRCPATDMYGVLTRRVISEDDLERIRKGKTVQAGFDRKVPVDRDFLESLRREDLTARDFLPYADDLMILHGSKDEIIPPASVRAFAEENVIEFELIEGADHRFQDPGKMDIATAKVLAFFGLR